MLGLGIDTGGTCTDAVIYDFDTGKVLSGAKAQTTKSNLEIGIENAIAALDQTLVKKIGRVALSTTLATNACLENKGARAKLLMIGFYTDLMEKLRGAYASYGLTDPDRLVMVDAKVEGLYSHPYDPDWEMIRQKAPAWFADCDSVGIVQKHPRGNGGRFELTAQKILQEELSQPITISYDISNETDILKTCAGTMLNARLIPLLVEFIEAVHQILARRGLTAPVYIIRSDGTMMPEEMAKQYPVETILCGPAASTVGGNALAGHEDAMIVDMGGTTTDIAIVRDGLPVLARGGIRIGQWNTMVKGLYVETIGLGGDSAVRYNDKNMYLDTERVIPLSVLAASWDHVAECLEKLAERKLYLMVPAYEFYVLQKDIAGVGGYSAYEHRICDALREKPLHVLELAERMNKYPKLLGTERLEADGVVIRSGLTPTDMMILKGDFDLYDARAARAAIQSLALNTEHAPDEIPDMVYEMVYRRLYDTLARVILQQQFARRKDSLSQEYLQEMLDCFYEQAVERLEREEKAGSAETADTAEAPDPSGTAGTSPPLHIAETALTTQFPLIGVGAPIHIFLPRVAKLLGTQVNIPAHAGVANALGAVACRTAVHVQLTIRARYENAAYVGMEFSEDGRRYFFYEEADAVRSGEKVLIRKLEEKAKMRGMKQPLQIRTYREDCRLGHVATGLLFEITLHAEATEK